MGSNPPPMQFMAVAADRHGSRTSHPASNALHSVKKPSPNPGKKKTAAVPIPPRVYRIDRRDFRQLVQMLTGATHLETRRLRNSAPAPLEMPPRTTTAATTYVSPQPPAMLPMQALIHGGASLPSAHSTSGFAYNNIPAFPVAEAAAPTAPEQMSAEIGLRQPQLYTEGSPSPSLYSACMAWCNTPLPSPSSTALELSTAP